MIWLFIYAVKFLSPVVFMLNVFSVCMFCYFVVHRRTPDGVSIAAYVDDIQGSGSDVNSVNSMVQSVIDDWTRQYGSDIYRQVSWEMTE